MQSRDEAWEGQRGHRGDRGDGEGGQEEGAGAPVQHRQEECRGGRGTAIYILLPVYSGVKNLFAYLSPDSVAQKSSVNTDISFYVLSFLLSDLVMAVTKNILLLSYPIS